MQEQDDRPNLSTGGHSSRDHSTLSDKSTRQRNSRSRSKSPSRGRKRSPSPRNRSPASSSSSYRGGRRGSPDYTAGSTDNNGRRRQSQSPPQRGQYQHARREYHDGDSRRDVINSTSSSQYGDNNTNRNQRRKNENDTLEQEPQLEVILQGLPSGCTEDDIRNVIEERDIGLESVRVARDRRTGESRGFGFLKFFTLKHARDFMEERSPSIRFGDYRARIAYSNNPSNNNASRDSPSKQAGYQASGHHRSQQQQSTLNFQGRGGQPFEHATQFYQQHSLQPHQQTSLNTGMQDIGQVPYSILLAMDLPPMVNEMGLWNAFNTLGPLRRVMMAKDRQSRMNLGYCFAEYRDTESATAALEKAHSASFSIQKKPVVVHFASRASFIPAYAPTKWTLDFANECELALYWDEQAFLSIYEEQPAKSSKSAVQDLATSVDELDAFYASLGDLSKSGTSAGGRAAIFSLPSASSDALPAVQELPSLPSAAKMDDIQLAGIAAAHEAEQLAKAEDRKRKAAPPSIGIGGGGKKVSLNLQKWSTKQVELHSDDTTAAIPAQVSTMSSSNTMPVTIRKIEQPTGFVPVPSPQKSLQPQQQQLEQQEDIEDWNSYDPDELLDLKLVACLLCQRKFKTEVELRKHQSLSDLHKKNLADPQAVQSALRKARSKPQGNNNTAQSPGSSPAKKTLAGVGATGDDEPKYRDRAAERRQIFGQPDYPLPPMPAAGSRHAGSFGRDRGGFEESVIPEQPTKDGIKEDNIGNRLLKSMGWKEGQGLGKDGGGIRDPIQASGYSRGVGIGAGVVGPGGSSGSSDRRGGTGGGGYQALSAKELARRRYEQSGQQQ